MLTVLLFNGFCTNIFFYVNDVVVVLINFKIILDLTLSGLDLHYFILNRINSLISSLILFIRHNYIALYLSLAQDFFFIIYYL